MKRFISIVLFALFHLSTFSQRIRSEHNYRMIEPKNQIAVPDKTKTTKSDCTYLICL